MFGCKHVEIPGQAKHVYQCLAKNPTGFIPGIEVELQHVKKNNDRIYLL